MTLRAATVYKGVKGLANCLPLSLKSSRGINFDSVLDFILNDMFTESLSSILKDIKGNWEKKTKQTAEQTMKNLSLSVEVKKKSMNTSFSTTTN